MPIGPWGWAHLLGFGILLPYAAYRSAARLQRGPLPPRARHFQVVLVQQAAFAALSLAVARLERIVLFPAPDVSPPALALGLLSLLGALGVMPRYWRRPVERRARLAYFFMPRTREDKRLWAALALVAGIGEEVTYRGVMYTLLLRLTGVPAAAALGTAAVFGISHSVQGWGSALATAAFGLGFQGLALVSGSLYLPMAVHVGYDLAAGLAYSRYGAELGYPENGPGDGAGEGQPGPGGASRTPPSPAAAVFLSPPDCSGRDGNATRGGTGRGSRPVQSGPGAALASISAPPPAP